MRVLLVTNGWPTKRRPTAGVFIARRAEFLRRAGAHVDVFHFEGRTNPVRYAAARRRVRSQIKGGSYDVVLVYFGQTALTVLPVSVPVVLTLLGSDLFGVIGRDGRPSARGRALRAITRALARRVDHVILSSRRMAAALPPHIRYDVLPIGVDPDVFTPQPSDVARRELGLSVDHRLVLFAADPSNAVKRYDLARTAVDIVSSSLPVDLVTVFGRPQDELVKYMSACDALILTSVHEGAPLVVREALACGLPVVSTDVGDVAELIGGVDGCALTTDDSPQAIADGLARVLAEPKRLDRSAFDHLSEEHLSARLLAILERVMQRNA